MKIVCAIPPRPPMIYFVNRIHERYPVSLVVLESPPPVGSLRRNYSQKGLGAIPEILQGILDDRLNRARYIREYTKFFGDRWRAIHPDIPVLHCDSVNAPAVYERLKRESPFLLLDHGTSIIQDATLDLADLALNLHWGLSPYYRGTRGTHWALINWDPLNIGVTVHRLNHVIDGGEILAQQRAQLRGDETVNAINMQLTYLGTELMLQALDKVRDGEPLRFFPQDLSRGFLTSRQQWNLALKRQVDHIEKSGTLRKMLEQPARRERLPIVELR